VNCTVYSSSARTPVITVNAPFWGEMKSGSSILLNVDTTSFDVISLPL
jgi:hypothetical protein